MPAGAGSVRPFVLTLMGMLLAGSLSVALAQPAAAPDSAAEVESFPVMVWNREITRFRVPRQGIPPAQRAEGAARRILDIPQDLPEYLVETRAATLGTENGVAVLVNGNLVLGLLERDADLAAGETPAAAAERAAANLRAWLASREEQMRWPAILRGVIWTAVATAAAGILIPLLISISRRLLRRIESEAHHSKRPLKLGNADMRPYIRTVEAGLVKTLIWAFVAAALYVWLTFAFQQFPYTRPWGQNLGEFIVNVFRQLGLGVVHSIPNLFIVAVIFMATRLVARVATAFFRGAAAQGMEVEVAHATQRLIVGLLWVFALVVAYPYLPGSGTAAFQGISVFIGVMVSLGATGIVSQLLGGLVVVYSRAFGLGDYVRIGDHEGTVMEIGALAAKVQTRRKEEITIPHSVVVNSATTNFSRQARTAGAIVSTKVAVGYDAPWRQVEAMLLEAAGRTPPILRTPPAKVLKSALENFYVEYNLLFQITRPEERYHVLSELHANILDAFNEHGVQIMTPAFEGQPEGRVVVPKSKWFAPPARAVDGGSGLKN